LAGEAVDFVAINVDHGVSVTVGQPELTSVPAGRPP
jgi:hypothetical protein